MALQGSGAISLAQIQAEFGGSNPISMSEYYRGGAYVGSSNTNVPTSGGIAMSQFYGAAAFDPYPTDYPAIYLNGSDYFSGSVGAQEQYTFTGINTAVTLRMTIDGTCGVSSNAQGSASVSVGILSGSGSGDSQNWDKNQTASKSFTFVINNNTTVRFYSGLSIYGDGATGDFNATFVIDNLTSGQNGVASGNIGLACSTNGEPGDAGLG